MNMSLLEINDLNECIRYLEKLCLQAPHMISMVQLMKTADIYHMIEYTFHYVLEQGESGSNHAGITAKCKPSVRTEYHIAFKDQCFDTIAKVLSSNLDLDEYNRFDSLPIQQITIVKELAERNGVYLESDVPARLDTFVLCSRNELSNQGSVHCTHMGLQGTEPWVNIGGSEGVPMATHIDDVVITRLNSEDAEMINSHWDYKYPGSEARIRVYIVKGVGYGLRVRGQLVSWALLNHRGKIAFVNTVPEFRRRGYACMVVSTLCRHLMEQGLTPIADIAINNTASEQLFVSKLGFKRTNECGSVTLCPR